MSDQKRKTLVLGLDGATWTVLKHLLEKGELPTLSRLVKSCASGTLSSSIPPLTAPAWVSFQTGANPGKHGLYDFRIYNREQRQVHLVSSRDIRLPTLWQIVSNAGGRVIAINVPVTTPPQPVNGIIIGGMLSQSLDRSVIYPPERFDEIFRRHPHYRISPPVISQRGQMGIKAFVNANIDVEHFRTELALDLLQSEQWDLFMLQNQSLDYIQHAYFQHLDPSAKEYDPDKHQEVLRFFQAMDDNVRRILDAIPEETDVVLLSDHGFKLQHRLVYLTTWLRKEGYFVERIDARQRMLQLARKLDIFKLRRHLAHKILQTKSKRFGAAANAAISRIDWSRSRAYSPIGSVYGMIFLDHDNLEYESIRDEIITKLSKLRDAQDGRKIVKQIYLGDEIYEGEYRKDGPDIILEPEDDYTFAAPALISPQKIVSEIGFDLEIPGGHHPDGILIWQGEGTKHISGLKANLVDVAPTILARMGIPIPAHMDGQVLDDIFLYPPPREYVPWEASEDKSQSPEFGDDDQALSQRLRDLGYL